MKYAYSREAIWTCDLVETVGTDGRLRCALILLTPFVRRFHEFPTYLPRDERYDAAREFIRSAYLEEDWFRRPRVIECADEALYEHLRELPLRPAFRGCHRGVRLQTARQDFIQRCKELRRPRYIAA